MTVQGTIEHLDDYRHFFFFVLLRADEVLHRPVKMSNQVSLLAFLAVAPDPDEEGHHLECKHHLPFDLHLMLALISLES